MKRLIALGIMLLFLGMTISSTTGLYLEKQSIKPKSFGNILYVGGNGQGNYSKIQDAIDNSSDGDTVFVYDDSSPYYENVVVNKSINLIGEDKDTTSIYGWEYCYVVDISADWVNISGFAILNIYDSGGIYLDSYGNNISGNNITTYVEGEIGIHLSDSSNNTIMGNTITSCYQYGDGIRLSTSSNNTIAGNLISNNFNGIRLSKSSNDNNITDNKFSNNYMSIWLGLSNNNNIIGTNFLHNQHDIGLQNSCNNTIAGNTFSDTRCCACIKLCYSNSNNITDNTINSASGDGIMIQYSLSNTIIGNAILNCGCGIRLWNSSNNTISCNNIIFSNHWYGIQCWAPPLNKEHSIHLTDSRCNNINGNNIPNDSYGMHYFYSGNNNTIYHNNFINNTPQNAYDEFNNLWDDGYPSGGNYWDDYNGTDEDGDGIGDTPYPISGGDNEDRYPLMEPYGGNDTLPPITTISFDPATPDGDNGWYVNDVTVTLNATDDGFGVKAIYYRVAGGEWKNHTGDVLTFILAHDCLEDGLIEFYSVDYAGNQEETKSVSIDMDQLPPDIEEVTWESFQDPPIYGLWYVTFTVNATDACSGMDRVEMFVNDGVHEIIVGAGPTYEFTTEWWTVFMRVTFRFYCCDEAGNVASVLVNGPLLNQIIMRLMES